MLMSNTGRSDPTGDDPDKFQHWKVLKNREVYVAEPWIRLSVQQVQLPDGRIVDEYHRVEFPEYAVVFAQTARGEVILEKQYKHGVGRCSLVLPSGLLEKGEDSLAAARRELLEETGYASDLWRPLGNFVVNGNYGCGRAHLFHARNASKVAEPNSGDLEVMEIITLKLQEVVEAVRNGEVALLGSVAAIALATNHLFDRTSDAGQFTGWNSVSG